MNLKDKYPKIFEKLEDTDIELRHLLNVDENYEDFDSEEYEFDFEEYNYVIYIAKPIQDILGEAKMDELMVKIHDNDAFINFLATEKDLYGVKSTLSLGELEDLVLNQVEEIV
jgi:hypothetical protein